MAARAVLAAGRRGLRSGLAGRDLLLNILQPQRQLIGVQCLGAAAEAVALQFLDDLAQPLDLGVGMVLGQQSGRVLGPLLQEQGRQLRRRQPHHPILQSGPGEGSLFERLGQEPQARSIPPDQLHPVGPLGAEDVHYARVGILEQMVLHQRRQAAHAFAEVHRTGRHQNPHRGRRTREGRDHRTAFSALITAATVLASAQRRTQTTTYSISSSMSPRPDRPRGSSPSPASGIRERWGPDSAYDEAVKKSRFSEEKIAYALKQAGTKALRSSRPIAVLRQAKQSASN